MSVPVTLADEPLSIPEKASLFGTMLKTLFVGIWTLILSPFRGAHSPPSLRKHLVYECAKTFLNGASLRHLLWIGQPTDDTYRSLAQRRGFSPDSFALSDGSKAHWIGNRSAKKVVLYFHGGGYVNYATPGHLDFLLDLQQTLARQGHDVAICVLAYTLISVKAWPNPLRQASEALSTLIEKYDKKPEDILISGDSAGANLAVALLSHLLHPHPSGIPPVTLAAPLAGAALISPWVSFDVTLPAHRSNLPTDVLDGYFLENTSRQVVGPQGSDEYIEPTTANVEWFKGLDSVVGDILIWGGGCEVLIDSIRAFANGLKVAHARTETLIAPKGAHIEIIVDVALGYPKSSSCLELQQWIGKRF